MTDEQRALLEWIENNESLITQAMRSEAHACKEAAARASTETAASIFTDAHRGWMVKVVEFEALMENDVLFSPM